MKKRILLKAALVGAVILLAAFLVTCGGALPEGGDSLSSVPEYTDVVYNFDSHENVTSITMYLDGTQVPTPAAQKRALGLEIARRTHDYFEAVFAYLPAGTSANPSIARANWEIGQQAGIRGVFRNGVTGVDYTSVTYPTLSSTVSGAASVIFVGKKTNKTLLAVGWMTHIDDTAITFSSNVADQKVNENTISVTFTVAPLRNWLGFESVKVSDGPPIVYEEKLKVRTKYGNVDATPSNNDVATFITAAKDTGAAGTGTPAYYTTADWVYGTASVANTLGTNTTVTGGLAFPIFYLPSVKDWATGITGAWVEATYTIGGLSGITSTVLTGALAGGQPPGSNTSATGDDGTLWPAVKFWSPPDGTIDTAGLPGGLQFMEREAAYIYQGQTYGVTEAALDLKTTVQIDLEKYKHPGGGTPRAFIAGDEFNPVIPLIFKQDKNSAGVFAITFEGPVYALVPWDIALTTTTLGGPLLSTNGGPEGVKWNIAPGYGTYNYLLDNGIDAGGMVMLSTDVGALDIIWIKTKGIGFAH